MALLDCHGLTRRPFFEAKSLTLEPGEVVVLSGPSGSGKTLFLRALADLDPTDAGDVWLDGTRREDVEAPVWRSRVLYVHQSGVRLPGTVRDNREAVAGLAVRAESAPEVQGEPGLDPDADADRLSGGEAQALALERALSCHPRVLLLDEATSAMDPETAERWEARILAFAALGGAVLWVAHDERIATRLAARRERFA